MIEVVAIDNRGAEAELLRLAADFAESRLLTPQQKKRLRFIVEVTGTAAPAPIAREQLVRKPGLFKSSQHHLTATISLLHGFDSAALQLMHELVHISQIINNRYQLSAKTVKQDGVKQRAYQAKWLGKKVGFIDQIDWQERPWEQEAATMGQQLSAEFMAFLYGTQSNFAAQNHEKGAGKMLRLYALAIALPIAPPMPEMPIAPVLDAPVLDAPVLDAPALDSPVLDTPALDAPGTVDDLTAAIPDFGAAPFGAPDADNGAQSEEPNDALLADIDALLSADAMAKEQEIPPAEALHDEAILSDVPAFDSAPEMPPEEMPPEEMPNSQSGEKQTYVLGIAEPRSLKLSVLEAKRQELASRGLLEG